MFLTKPDLIELTGYRSSAAQIRWLTRNGYRFDIRSDGRPVVLRQQIQERQCSKISPTAEGPDLSWLD